MLQNLEGVGEGRVLTGKGEGDETEELNRTATKIVKKELIFLQSRNDFKGIRYKVSINISGITCIKCMR